MVSAVKRQWFLAALFILLPLGIVLGRSHTAVGLSRIVDGIPVVLCTGGILFLMSVTLDTRKLIESVRRPLPVLTACGINMILIPMLCLLLMKFQKTPELRVGLLIAASVPCTMAAASVWTRRAMGNDAVSLLVTLVTNGLCFLLTPAWMEAGRLVGNTVDISRGLTFTDMMLRLMVGALIPALAGQLTRLSEVIRRRVDDHADRISVAAQVIILCIIFISAFKGGEKFDFDGDGVPIAELLLVWACCILLHVAGAFANWGIGGVAGFAAAERRAIVFSGSQKTLPVGLILSDATGMPLSIIPMLMYHGSQLVIDTWIAGRMVKSVEVAAPGRDSDGGLNESAE